MLINLPFWKNTLNNLKPESGTYELDNTHNLSNNLLMLAMFDEGSGNYTSALGTLGNVFRTTTNASWATNGVNFTSGSGWISQLSTNITGVGSPFTMMVNITTGISDGNLINVMGIGGLSDRRMMDIIYIASTSMGFHFYGVGNADFYPFQAGENRILLVHSGSNVKIYSNGQLLGTRNLSSPIELINSQVKLGGATYPDFNTSASHYVLHDAALWARAFSEQDITTFYSTPYAMLKLK